MHKGSHILGNEKIGKLLIKLSLPAMVGMLVQATYNLVDTIFVGQGVGMNAIGGIAIVFPIQVIIMAIGIGLGIGGSSLISRALGAKNKELASKTLGNMVGASLAIGILFTIISFLFFDNILDIFGAKTETLMTYAKEYFSVILWGIPLISFSVTTNNAVRAEGNANVAMGTMLVGALLNIILDPIFIFGLNMGVKGAALATLISQLATSVYLFAYLQGGKSELHLRMENLFPRMAVMKEIVKVGGASFVRQIAGSIMVAILNNALVYYGGEIGVTFFGIAFRLISFMMMPIFGIYQGFQPIAGYNYGAKQHSRVKESLKLAILWASVISVVGSALLMIFPGQIMSIFGGNKEELAPLLEMGIPALRIIVMLMPLVGFQIVSASLFQALGKALPAMILTLSRQVIFIIPLILILPRIFGINGVWIAFPISDLLSAVITLIYLIVEIKLLNKCDLEEFHCK